MLFPSMINRPLLYQEVVNALYQIIDERQILPGAQFPTERELMHTLGVSRNVLREAFHILEQRGIVHSHQGKGRFLRSLPQSKLISAKYQLSKSLERHSLLEAYEVRQVLEVKAMELIVRNASQQDLAEIENAYWQMLKSFEDTGTTIGEFELHRLYAAKTGSLFMEQTLWLTLSTILGMMHTTSHDILDMHIVESEAQDHRNIIDALVARDAAAAKTIMYNHIQKTINILQD